MAINWVCVARQPSLALCSDPPSLPIGPSYSYALERCGCYGRLRQRGRTISRPPGPHHAPSTQHGTRC